MRSVTGVGVGVGVGLGLMGVDSSASDESVGPSCRVGGSESPVGSASTCISPCLSAGDCRGVVFGVFRGDGFKTSAISPFGPRRPSTTLAVDFLRSRPFRVALASTCSPAMSRNFRI